METSSDRYGRLSVVIHWATLALLVAVYACIELREMYPRGSEIREALKTWHYMLGLTVFFLVWVRITARLFGKTPPIVPATPKWQLIIANSVELALYALMIALPLLGWVMLSAEGKSIPFFGLQLPALVGSNEALAERTKEVHETLATIGYFLIGLHAIAALFHHYVRRDNTLRRMRVSH
ncbi:MAG TPA: cytochrome b [Povalibacter sp.]